MTSIRQIGEFLESPEWNAGEKFVIKWQFNRSLQLLGDFGAALAEAIVRADDSNLTKLALGFPDEVAGFLAWNRGDLGIRLRDAGLEI